MEILKVMPWGKDQGDHVLIDAKDFDPQKHTIYQPPAPAEEEKPKSSKKHKEEGEK